MVNHPNRNATVARAKKRLTAAVDTLNASLEAGCALAERKRLYRAMHDAHAQYNVAVAAAADHQRELAGIRQVAHLI